jgi:hypothetical protein
VTILVRDFSASVLIKFKFKVKSEMFRLRNLAIRVQICSQKFCGGEIATEVIAKHPNPNPKLKKKQKQRKSYSIK